MHPFLSIFGIYNPLYNRKVRVMDFFLNIYLSFFFTLLPFYNIENSQLSEMIAIRSVEYRYKTVNDLEIKFKQVILIYFISLKYTNLKEL